MATTWGDGLEQSLEVLEGMENYTTIVYQRFRPYVGQKTLEVGCGYGSYTRHLVRQGALLSTDIEPSFVARVREKFGCRDNFRAEVSGGDLAENRAVREFAPDTIVCVNVLEHIEDDAAFLRQLMAVLASGGNMILLVPAYQWLFGSLDRSFGHYRRYSLRELHEKTAAAGFTFVYSSYLSPMSIPGWFLQGRVLGKTALDPAQLRFYDKYVVPLTSGSVRFLERWMGMSLLFVARKP